MRRIAILAAWVSLLFIGSALNAGTANQPFTITKDPQAIAVVQAAIAAMGGPTALASYQDSDATGTLTQNAGGSPVNFPIVLKSKGTHQTRVELQRPNGTTIRIINQGQGAIQKVNGSTIQLSVSNILSERVNHVPLLSLIAEYQNANVSVTYQGTAQVNGQSTEVVAVSFVPSNDPVQGPLFAKMTQTLFYVDQTTNLIDKIQYTTLDEGNHNDRYKVETYLGKYQTVDGIAVPFHQTTFVEGNPDSDLVLNSVAFNVGLSDSDFTLPQ